MSSHSAEAGAARGRADLVRGPLRPHPPGSRRYQARRARPTQRRKHGPDRTDTAGARDAAQRLAQSREPERPTRPHGIMPAALCRAGRSERPSSRVTQEQPQAAVEPTQPLCQALRARGSSVSGLSVGRPARASPTSGSGSDRIGGSWLAHEGLRPMVVRSSCGVHGRPRTDLCVSSHRSDHGSTLRLNIIPLSWCSAMWQ